MGIVFFSSATVYWLEKVSRHLSRTIDLIQWNLYPGNVTWGSVSEEREKKNAHPHIFHLKYNCLQAEQIAFHLNANSRPAFGAVQQWDRAWRVGAVSPTMHRRLNANPLMEKDIRNEHLYRKTLKCLLISFTLLNVHLNKHHPNWPEECVTGVLFV